MQSIILVLILFLTLALVACAEWRTPGNATSLKVLLVVVALLALVGLLGLWGLPIATDIITGVFST